MLASPAAIRRGLIAASVLLLALASAADGGQGSVSLDVPGGALKRIGLPDLPEGASISVELHSTGEIAVAFVAGRDRKADASVPPLFAGRLDRRLAFSVQIPAAGTYYVVLDNRRGAAPRAVTVHIRGISPGQPGAAPKIRPLL